MATPGGRLRGLRKALKPKHSQGDVAKAIGTRQSTISDIERGETINPSSPVLLKLAAFYEVEPHWIVTGQGPKHTVTSKDDKETELLLYFRSMSAEGRDYLLARARDMHKDEHRSRDPGNGEHPGKHKPGRFQ